MRGDAPRSDVVTGPQANAATAAAPGKGFAAAVSSAGAVTSAASGTQPDAGHSGLVGPPPPAAVPRSAAHVSDTARQMDAFAQVVARQAAQATAATATTASSTTPDPQSNPPSAPAAPNTPAPTAGSARQPASPPPDVTPPRPSSPAPPPPGSASSSANPSSIAPTTTAGATGKAGGGSVPATVSAARSAPTAPTSAAPVPDPAAPQEKTAPTPVRPASPTPPVVSPPPTSSTSATAGIQLSNQAQQAFRADAFTKVVAQQAQQIGATGASSWPAGGVSTGMHAMLDQLVQQASADTSSPQQVLRAQLWSTALAQSILGAAQTAGRAAETPNLPRHGPPAMQPWLVLNGEISGSDATRPFRLTLHMPVTWLAQHAAERAAVGPGLPTPPGAWGDGMGVGLGPGTLGALPGSALVRLTVGGSVQSLGSLTMALVLQGRPATGTGLALSARQDTQPAAQQAQQQVSALLQLEMQSTQPPSAAQIAQAAAHLPAQMLTPDIQAALQNRNLDPWLLMAQYYASGHAPHRDQHAGERPGTCVIAGCQYEGRAICAQPFCAQMNYLWSVARAQSRA